MTAARATAALLFLAIFGGLLLAAVIAAGQDVMCNVHDDALRYCAGYEAAS